MVSDVWQFSTEAYPKRGGHKQDRNVANTGHMNPTRAHKKRNPMSICWKFFYLYKRPKKYFDPFLHPH